MDRPPELPDFAHPPVVEVALSVMFESLPLQSVHVGQIWGDHFRSEYPNTADLPLLDTPIERERDRTPVHTVPQLELLTMPRLRTWFVSDAGTHLIQLQHDRFAHNWRTGERKEDYPRWNAIRDPFKNEVGQFEQFIAKEGIGSLVPRQCEVTYVNHIIAGRAWSNHSEIDRVFSSLWATGRTPGFLPQIEDGRFVVRYAIRDGNSFRGRLHVSVQPAFQNSGGNEVPLYLVNLTARGAPLEPTLPAAFDFLELGREWIVRAFTELTTSDMHNVWERKQ